jgi:hypothetical protein
MALVLDSYLTCIELAKVPVFLGAKAVAFTLTCSATFDTNMAAALSMPSEALERLFKRLVRSA